MFQLLVTFLLHENFIYSPFCIDISCSVKFIQVIERYCGMSVFLIVFVNLCTRYLCIMVFFGGFYMPFRFEIFSIVHIEKSVEL